MEKALTTIIEAAKGQKDLLAFLAIVIVAAILSPQIGLTAAIFFALAMLGGWIGLRWALVKIHSRERLQEFRDRAKIESLRVLAKHGTKADIKAMIEDLSKEGGEP